MIIMGGSNYAGDKLIDMMPHISFSGDGLNFSQPQPAEIVIWKNILWISYYSSHEGKTSIYMAKIKLDQF